MSGVQTIKTHKQSENIVESYSSPSPLRTIPRNQPTDQPPQPSSVLHFPFFSRKKQEQTLKKKLVSELQILIDPVGSHPEEKCGQGATDLD